MSMLQRNRASSFSFLLSAKPRSSSRTRRGSGSFITSQLESLTSCPTLFAASSAKEEIGTSKRARVTSAPFIRRKGDFVGSDQAHGGYCHRHSGSGLLPFQSATLTKALPMDSTSDNSSEQPVSFEVSSLISRTPDRSMPKAPQLSYRSPTSQPIMHPLQSGVYAPVAKSPVSPQISFSVPPNSLYGCHSMATVPQNATYAAVLEPHRRSPPPGREPALRIVCSSEEEYVLSAHLPGFAPEMVTVSARKEDKLAVVADLWHAETNCHYEWLVAFSSRDANVLQTRAQISADGILTIHVPRRDENFYLRRNRLR